MEKSMVSNCVRRTIFSNQEISTTIMQEESSWTIYFEDHDQDDHHIGHYIEDSSMISDAASPVVAVEEDTASSPSNKTKCYNEMEENTIGEKTITNSTTNQVKKSSTNGIKNEEYCAELKKRGLCLVPLSMLSNYIG